MSDKEELRFNVGDDVLIHQEGFGAFLMKDKVSKIYKNSDFRCEASSTRFRQSGGCRSVPRYDTNPVRVEIFSAERWHELKQPFIFRRNVRKIIDFVNYAKFENDFKAIEDMAELVKEDGNDPRHR